MNSFSLKTLGCSLLLLPVLAYGDTQTFSYNGVNLAIPDYDGSNNGVVNNQVVSGMLGAITSIQITLNIAATTDQNGQTFANSGDYYVALTHTVGTQAEGFSVLLNRSGVSSL